MSVDESHSTTAEDIIAALDEGETVTIDAQFLVTLVGRVTRAERRLRTLEQAEADRRESHDLTTKLYASTVTAQGERLRRLEKQVKDLEGRESVR